MKLVPRRQKNKKDQALDTLASVAKAWSEWQLAKKGTKAAGRGVRRAAEAGVVVKAVPTRAIGAAAVAGGVAFAAIRKRKRASAQAAQTYSPPVQPPAPVSVPPAPVATPGAPSPPIPSPVGESQEPPQPREDDPGDKGSEEAPVTPATTAQPDPEPDLDEAQNSA